MAKTGRLLIDIFGKYCTPLECLNMLDESDVQPKAGSRKAIATSLRLLARTQSFHRPHEPRGAGGNEARKNDSSA